MNPIAIVAILGALGFAVFKFLKQPVIEQERAPETATEKALDQADEALGKLLSLGSNILDGFNTIADDVSRGFEGRRWTHDAEFLSWLWEGRSQFTTLDGTFNYMSHKHWVYKFMARSTKDASAYGKPSVILRAMINVIERECARNPGGSAFNVDGIPIQSALVFQDLHRRILSTGTFLSTDITTHSDVIKEIHGKDNQYNNIWRYIPSTVNTFPIMTKYQFLKPWDTAPTNIPYFLYTVFPGWNEVYAVFARINNNRISEFHQTEFSRLTSDARLKIGPTLLFGAFENVFRGFIQKKEIAGGNVYSKFNQ